MYASASGNFPILSDIVMLLALFLIAIGQSKYQNKANPKRSKRNDAGDRNNKDNNRIIININPSDFK